MLDLAQHALHHPEPTAAHCRAMFEDSLRLQQLASVPKKQRHDYLLGWARAGLGALISMYQESQRLGEDA